MFLPSDVLAHGFAQIRFLVISLAYFHFRSKGVERIGPSLRSSFGLHAQFSSSLSFQPPVLPPFWIHEQGVGLVFSVFF
jgi:hypothetical protein